MELIQDHTSRRTLIQLTAQETAVVASGEPLASGNGDVVITGKLGIKVDGPVSEARTRLANIFEALIREREWQNDKYGPVIQRDARGEEMFDHNVPIQGPGGHEIGAWAIIIEKELDELKDAIVHGGNHAKGRDTARAELVQIAAVCVAALEQHGLGDK